MVTEIPKRLGQIEVAVVVDDVASFRTDVLVLKYAQDLYGADRAIVELLIASQIRVRLPKRSESSTVATGQVIPAKRVIFIGVEKLYEFGYSGIRRFASSAMSTSALIEPAVETLAMTIHGTGYGLDEAEAFRSELAGIRDALKAGTFPHSLKRIYFVERNAQRADRLASILNESLSGGLISTAPVASAHKDARSEKENSVDSAGLSSSNKRSVFVAMPFAEVMDDVFHYGIQNAVNSAGFLCERADLTSFTGDVMDWVKRRISIASLVIADLSTANPNVYLEVGFAWGQGIPTILVVKDSADLKFDVRGQRCLVYRSIKNLEDSLSRELITLARPNNT